MGADLRGLYDPKDKPDDFEVLPNGTYTVKVAGGEMKDTKNRDGKFLQVVMTVVEGAYEGKKIIDRFNLVNKSQEAVRIARAQFASLREAVGILDPKDVAALAGPRFQLVLKCVKRNDKPDEMTNEVARYIKRGQAATTPQQQATDAPWSRNAPKADMPPPAPPADPADPFASGGTAGVPW